MKRNDLGVTSGSSALPRHMWSVSGMWPVKDNPLGMWVSHDAAQSRIAELEAEVERLRGLTGDDIFSLINQAHNDALSFAHEQIDGWVDVYGDEPAKRIRALRR